ncbi:MULTISPECIES: hypothetical protein [unclassified Streptomyces]|uniref:hypothetical protein n=1 Tax=unclassified Streptomyces TaxID=2593676 RepID=UPI002E12BA47|nr:MULTISPECIES: hypothetical protein [unclassified Streptomyces]WSR27429.1 hypothetical protein OG573_15615 [Streptomyces sp. NBC_01205]
MAWNEWENAKAEAVAQRQVSMRLNQLPGGPAGSSGEADLVVHQDDLGDVGHEAFALHGKLQKEADIAGAGSNPEGAGSTMQAAAALKASTFALGGELETTVSVWTSQVRTVLQACAHISNHLDYSKKAHAEDDAAIAASLRNRDGSAVPVSRLAEYFK